MPFIFKFAYWSSSHWKSLLKLAIKLTAKEYLKDPVKAGRSDFKRYSEIDYQTYCNNPEIEKLFLKSALVKNLFFLKKIIIFFRKCILENKKIMNGMNILYFIKIGDFPF
jgi:hypothetical protein